MADINFDTKVDVEMQVLNEKDDLYGQDYQEMHACYLLLFADFEIYPKKIYILCFSSETKMEICFVNTKIVCI